MKIDVNKFVENDIFDNLQRASGKLVFRNIGIKLNLLLKNLVTKSCQAKSPKPIRLKQSVAPNFLLKYFCLVGIVERCKQTFSDKKRFYFQSKEAHLEI
jgi:hypothetical protein